MSPRNVIRQNQFVFMDFFGPMHDGDHILVLYDPFDELLVLAAMRATALNIVKAVLSLWIYIYGFIENLGHDNGQNLTSKIVTVFKYVMGMKAVNICQYTPWTNPSETKMRGLAQGITINKLAIDKYNLDGVYAQLDRNFPNSLNRNGPKNTKFSVKIK